MWLYLIAGVLLILGLGGGLAFGGIFTIVLVPLAGIALVAALLSAMWSRASQGSAGGETGAAPATNPPLPHSRRRDSGHVPTSPEQLADARRTEQ
jgi:hypothetical protein